MTLDQGLIFAILALAVGLFLWGRLRHDVVALAALLAAVVLGLVPSDTAFEGFGHPAVITVACVLVLSHGLQSSGAVDLLARRALPREAGQLGSMAALIGLGAVLSSFMNNVGAMALLMPVALQLARRLDLAPGQVLMPLAFGTILGGMTTLVGTPPNLIVSGFREDAGRGAFGFFAFTPVGLSVAVLGVLFVVAVGWRIVPLRKPASAEGFETGAYLTEVRIPEGSRAVGLTPREFEEGMESSDAQIVGLVRNEVRIAAPQGWRRIRAGDILIIEADVETLSETLSAFGIRLEEDEAEKKKQKEKEVEKDAETATTDKDDSEGTKEGEETQHRDEELVLRELAVLPTAQIAGRSASDLRLRTRYGINLLAVSRAGRPPTARLRTLKLKSGDLLLVQGPAEIIADFASETGCVPLGERSLRLPDRQRAALAVGIMAAAILLVTLGLLPAAPAFALGVLASMVLRTVPLREVYTAIDWPVIVLLAALIPVAGAMQATGAADLLARWLLDTVAQGNAVAALGVVMVTTMFLSDVMNNAATAAVMCPIALGIAAGLGVSPDSFLMAVAIGASCAFLTPIGHQNNTLILGPGGFRFGDYWRLGLLLEVLVVAVSLPMLLLVWPL
ncbi:TRAP transporter large permease subunit [Halovulum dunhuangense]|uniref:TRAP transporter large permease subunit n=1 Tax=Halovulum dunhuangense TaxID=1505036 RepID=A0A849L1J1_9RHOB|nr:SLC13 family permease [Halovulum dunhuangense]NNU80156.1 TRAP transporter large permease subunit [Halovulum dunhuangense]